MDPQIREFTERMRRLVDHSGLSVAELADSTGYSRTSWERYLGGRLLAPKGAVVALAETTGAHTVDLTTMWELAERAWSRAESGHDSTMEAIRVARTRAAHAGLTPATDPTTSTGTATDDPGPGRRGGAATGGRGGSGTSAGGGLGAGARGDSAPGADGTAGTGPRDDSGAAAGGGPASGSNSWGLAGYRGPSKATVRPGGGSPTRPAGLTGPSGTAALTLGTATPTPPTTTPAAPTGTPGTATPPTPTATPGAPAGTRGTAAPSTPTATPGAPAGTRGTATPPTLTATPGAPAGTRGTATPPTPTATPGAPAGTRGTAASPWPAPAGTAGTANAAPGAPAGTRGTAASPWPAPAGTRGTANAAPGAPTGTPGTPASTPPTGTPATGTPPTGTPGTRNFPGAPARTPAARGGQPATGHADPASPASPAGPASAANPVPPKRQQVLMFFAGMAGVLVIIAGVFLLTHRDGGGHPGKGAAPSARTRPSLPPGVKCAGSACTGKDAEAMGCSGDLVTTAKSVTLGTTVLEVRYSRTCGTVWGRITGGAPGDTVRLTVGGVRQSDGITAAGDTIAYTPMAAVRDPARSRACATLASGRSGCTN
ncbi:DUF2690 domain-containing protein [Streptomyces sp. NPDC006309]|uniref:helix-turn-helix domain-containing protein n=1 Tax=Streptomyces sp. NPDC006309 TaxID=3156749 RepID=UPI0033AE79C5